ncbi:hypothetical protein JCM5353_004664 [Sporobolomyces roseus]
MAQTTTTTLVQPPLPSYPTLIPPTQAPTPSTSSCSHVRDWLGTDSTLNLERFSLAATWNLGLDCGSTASVATPLCSLCRNTPLRPFLCLTCGISTCGSLSNSSHSHQHAQKEHHSLAWDLRSEAVYCFQCADYVSNPVLARLAKAEKLHRRDFTKPVEGPPSKKRKRTKLDLSRFASSDPSGSSALPLAVPARGIRNLGNSCYMSVILQSFFLNPFLKTYFLSDRHNRSTCSRATQGDPCMSCEVDGLFSEYYTIESPSLAPTKFLHAFWQSSYEALGYAQQDAHEFLISTLNLLHSHSPCPTDNPSKRCPCIVHTTFSGQLRSQVRCGRCGHQSETFEPFLDLSLDVRDRVLGKDHRRIEECLNSFTTAEKLPAQYDCAACGFSEQASKRLSIKALPQVLCVQLKRFEHTSATGSKIDTFVKFPLNLDMAPHLSSTLDYPAAAKPPHPQRFNLMSVVAHEGSLSQGHYTTYVRGTDDFLHIDDEKVRRAGLSEVLNSKAYLLVYSRI